MMDIRGKSVLITGASRGLGRALALVMSSAGAKLTLVARTSTALDEIVSEVRSHGGCVEGIAADVGDKESIYPIVGQAAALIGPVDILINNASTLGPVPLRLLADTDCEDLERALEVNTIGPFRLIKALAGSMVLRQTGLIINITSDAAVEAYPSWGAYSVSKIALDHLTRIAAAEFADTSLRFLSIDPGEMNTRMYLEAIPDADTGRLQSPASVAERIAAIIRHSDHIASGSRIVASDWKVVDETRTIAAQ